MRIKRVVFFNTDFFNVIIHWNGKFECLETIHVDNFISYIPKYISKYIDKVSVKNKQKA
jgi:hypothetical protein